MPYYVTYGRFQRYMKTYYLETGSRMQFWEMRDYLFAKGLILNSEPISNTFEADFDLMSDDEFNEIIDGINITLQPKIGGEYTVVENDIIPNLRDVFVIRHPRYTRPSLHKHNYFEINYVISGSCNFTFENNKLQLKEGELCIISPFSEHDIVINDDSTVFCIMLRKSTFNTTFFSLLSRKDLLSYFFRNILKDNSKSNYLLFDTSNNILIKKCARHALIECYKDDSYCNTCCINWINLMFSYLLRNYNDSLQFYNYEKMGTDFSIILKYIQENYQNINLSKLSEFFHYSEPYMCNLIKQNTGHNFTDLIKELRMAEAVDYILNTNIKISEIAEKVGYNSTDHFSRVFRSVYKISPQQYRKINKNSEEYFVPFETT